MLSTAVTEIIQQYNALSDTNKKDLKTKFPTISSVMHSKFLKKFNII